MPRKIRVAVIFGGKSTEHEVSLLSAKNVIAALDRTKYEPILIGIDKSGRWLIENNSSFLLKDTNPKQIQLVRSEKDITPLPRNVGHYSFPPVDVVFPVLHGTLGEDGTIQGLLKLADVPFVGAGVLGSAVGMDKDVQKRLLRDAGILTAKFLIFRDKNISFDKAERALGLPFFVKPANSGSSVGVSKVRSEKEFKKAVNTAFKYDSKILLEEAITGREIECSVLGNENPIASLPGEVIPTHEFYDYEAKYIDENGARLEIPAMLPAITIKKIQTIAIQAYKVLCCEGMARVDMFLRRNGEILISEINTIPGFTNISMYPKLWEVSGLSNKELVDKLINLALERFDKEQRLKRNK